MIRRGSPQRFARASRLAFWTWAKLVVNRVLLEARRAPAAQAARPMMIAAVLALGGERLPQLARLVRKSQFCHRTRRYAHPSF